MSRRTRRTRKSNNPAGRPVTVGGAAYLLKLTPELLKEVRDSAALQGLSLAEWWRNAAWLALGDALSRPDCRGELEAGRANAWVSRPLLVVIIVGALVLGAAAGAGA